jgi:hypothetical protein
VANSCIVEVIKEFFDPDGEEHIDQRSHRRETFHRPATIVSADGVEHFAFTRDISRDGLGLVHRQRIPTGPVEIILQLSTGTSVRVNAEIIWCGPYQGHYASRARVLEELSR